MAIASRRMRSSASRVPSSASTSADKSQTSSNPCRSQRLIALASIVRASGASAGRTRAEIAARDSSSSSIRRLDDLLPARDAAALRPDVRELLRDAIVQVASQPAALTGDGGGGRASAAVTVQHQHQADEEHDQAGGLE